MKYISVTNEKNSKLPVHVLRIVLTGLLAFMVFALSAQPKEYPEKVFVHLNRNIFFNGSILKYTAYLTNQHDTDLSSIVYFDLTNISNKKQISWKQEAPNGFATGAYEIPDSLESGSYVFRAYTNLMRNYPQQMIFSTPVVLQKLHENTNDTLPFENATIEQNGTNNLTDYLNLNIKEGYKPEIELSKTQKCNNAQISVSITEKTPLTNPVMMPTFMEYLNQSNTVSAKVEPCIQETNFYIISGQLTDHAKNTPIANEYVYLSYPDSSVHFKFDLTDEQGRFCFFLDSNYINRLIFLQANHPNCDSSSIAWTIFSKHIPIKPVEKTDYIYNMAEQDYYEQLQKRELIDRVYNTQPLTELASKQPTLLPDFFYQPDYSVRPDDYAELNDFREIIENLLLMVRYKNVNKTMVMGMVLKEVSSVVYDNVLCFIDGVPCFNMDYVSKLNSKEIDHIDVFNSVIMYGTLNINGIVAIYTQQGNFNQKAFCTPFYTFKYEFNNHSVTENSDKKLPNTLPDTYWAANLTIKDEPVVLHPKAIEIGTEYLITINGLVNGTIPVSYQQTLKVK